MGLSFRVRDGTGRFPHAMTAVTLAPPRTRLVAGVGKTGGYNMCSADGSAAVVLLCCCRFLCNSAAVAGLLFGNHIVDASSLVSLYHPWVRTPFETGLRGGVWCKLSAY